jgi:hypothetical protein
MAYQLKEMSGSLFRGNSTSERGPSHTGSALINGKMFRISAWVNTKPDGAKYFKLAFREHQLEVTSPKNNLDMGGDSIPF